MFSRPNIILIVDDESALRDAYRDALTKEKFEVFEAKNGEEALVHLKQHAVDLVLLDIAMPKKTGIEVLKEMRSGDARLKLIPVIIMSVFDERVTVHKELLGMGANSYLVKDKTSLDELVFEVRKYLRKQ